MPFLMSRRSSAERVEENAVWSAGTAFQAEPESRAGLGTAIFPRCANPQCASGWLRLWRSRSAPVFEGGWCCSPECTLTRVEAAVSRDLTRELTGDPGMRAGAAAGYRPRIPLGLVMLEQGWITAGDLRRALDAQRRAGSGRLGQWLMRNGAVDETKLTRALGLQWNCPVLSLDLYDPEMVALLVPRLFLDALGTLPLRVAAQRILYLGFEDRPDPVLAAALERMTGLRAESGVVEGSLFRAAHARALEARFAPVELMEAASESALARGLAAALEKMQPLESRLVRVHDFFWMRMWMRRQTGAMPRREGVRDLVCVLAQRSSAA